MYWEIFSPQSLLWFSRFRFRLRKLMFILMLVSGHSRHGPDAAFI
jgi:hypothetical protein